MARENGENIKEKRQRGERWLRELEELRGERENEWKNKDEKTADTERKEAVKQKL